MVFKMKGFPYAGKSPIKKYSIKEGPHKHPHADEKTPFEQDRLGTKYPNLPPEIKEQTSEDKPGTTEMVLVRADDIVDAKTGEVHQTENMPGDDRGLIPIMLDAETGMYYFTTYDGEEVYISPQHRSVVPRNLLDGVEMHEWKGVIDKYKESK